MVAPARRQAGTDRAGQAPPPHSRAAHPQGGRGARPTGFLMWGAPTGRAAVFSVAAFAPERRPCEPAGRCRGGPCGRPRLGEGQGDGGVGRGQVPPLHFNPLEGDSRARFFVIPAYAGIQSFVCGPCGRPRFGRGTRRWRRRAGASPAPTDGEVISHSHAPPTGRPLHSRGRYDGRAPVEPDRPRGTSMPRRTLCTLLLLAAGAVCSAADPSLFQGLHWRMIGPFRGGRILAVSGVPGQPDRFYFGAVSGGVWESGDAGRTWRPIFDGQPVNAIGALAVAPSDPAVIYVGTGEADMRSDITQGDGMYRSADGGQSWTHIGLDDSQQIGRILVDPRDPDRVFVAALGHPYGPNPERGVFRTTDGGRTWAKVLGPDDATGAIDLAFEPGRPDTLYAALWQARRTPWSVYPPLEGPGSGLWKSADGGDHWARIEGGGFPDADRPHRPRRGPQPPEPRVRPGRRPRGRALPLGRRRRPLDADQLRQPHLGPGLVLRQRHGGPGGRGPGLRPQHHPAALRRRRPPLRRRQRRRHRRRLPRAVDRPGGPRAADRGLGPGRPGHGERRADLELPDEPAHRPDLPRRDGLRLPLPRLRGAAGLGGREPAGVHPVRRRHRSRAGAGGHGRRRVRHDRARSRRPRRSSTAAPWTGSTCAPSRRGRWTRPSRFPACTVAPGRCR